MHTSDDVQGHDIHSNPTEPLLPRKTSPPLHSSDPRPTVHLPMFRHLRYLEVFRITADMKQPRRLPASEHQRLLSSPGRV